MEAAAAGGGGGGVHMHIVVFPWLAFGHMLPYLELSKSLARRGHLVSFISTPRNVQRLPKVPSEIAHLLRMVALPLPRVDGMPDGAEATSDLPTADGHRLRKALDGLEGPFAAFLKEPSHPKPDWIVHDFAHHWMPRVAAGVPCVFFSILSAACLAFLGPPSKMGCRKGLDDYTVSPPWVPFPSKVAYRRHEIMSISAQVQSPPPPQDDSSSGASELQRMQMSMESSEIVAVRTCAELEPEWLPLLEEVYPNLVVAVGLLPSVAAERADDGESAEIMGWLDERARKSVVYVALGSEVTVSVELLRELALGLEASGLPFLWALRRPCGLADGVEILPRGFEERVGPLGGKVVMGWAPQLKILAHPSVGGFLTHCGWGSIVESLQFGHPLVLLPVFADQGLNARMLEERGIGVEVERDEEDGSFTKNEVERAVKLIMVDEEGCAYRKRADEIKEAVADKERQQKYVDDFIGLLLAPTIKH